MRARRRASDPGERISDTRVRFTPTDSVVSSDRGRGARTSAAERAARAGNYLAMKVITQIGARLHHGAKAHWEYALSGV